MNLRALDQVVELHQNEAQALQAALGLYHRVLTWRSSQRPLFLSETMSIRATLRVRERLDKLLLGAWPRTRQQRLKARRWRVEFDELLQLHELMREGELFAADVSHRAAFQTLYGKLNHKALNLMEHFVL